MKHELVQHRLALGPICVIGLIINTLQPVHLHSSLSACRFFCFSTCGGFVRAVAILLSVIYGDTVASVEQHLHVLCLLVPHRLCAVSETRSILCVEGTQREHQMHEKSVMQQLLLL